MPNDHQDHARTPKELIARLVAGERRVVVPPAPAGCEALAEELRKFNLGLAHYCDVIERQIVAMAENNRIIADHTAASREAWQAAREAEGEGESWRDSPGGED